MNATQFQESKTAGGDSAAQPLGLLLPFDSSRLSFPKPLTLPDPASSPSGAELKSGQPANKRLVWQVPDDLGRVLANALRGRWDVYVGQLRICRQDFSETSVHRLRVSTRRLMTQLALAGYLTSDNQAGKARAKLKRRLKALGDLRDCQVQKAYVEARLTRFPEALLLHDVFAEREERLAKTVLAKIHRFKTQKLEQLISGLCDELMLAGENSEVKERTSGIVFCAITDAFSEVVRRREAALPRDSRGVHHTRVAFKSFRYMVEAASPGLTGFGKRDLRRLANYQRRMGSLQDLEVLQGFVERFTRRNPAANKLLQPFRRYLNARRSRVLGSCFDRLDDVFAFWPHQNSTSLSAAPVRRAA